MMPRIAETVDCWPSPEGSWTQWSVSECDEGGEITCIGGENSLRKSWAMAKRRARELGIPAQLCDDSGRVLERKEPSKAAVRRAQGLQ